MSDGEQIWPPYCAPVLPFTDYDEHLLDTVSKLVSNDASDEHKAAVAQILVAAASARRPALHRYMVQSRSCVIGGRPSSLSPLVEMMVAAPVAHSQLHDRRILESFRPGMPIVLPGPDHLGTVTRIRCVDFDASRPNVMARVRADHLGAVCDGDRPPLFAITDVAPISPANYYAAVVAVGDIVMFRTLSAAVCDGSTSAIDNPSSPPVFEPLFGGARGRRQGARGDGEVDGSAASTAVYGVVLDARLRGVDEDEVYARVGVCCSYHPTRLPTATEAYTDPFYSGYVSTDSEDDGGGSAAGSRRRRGHVSDSSSEDDEMLGYEVRGLGGGRARGDVEDVEAFDVQALLDLRGVGSVQGGVGAGRSLFGIAQRVVWVRARDIEVVQRLSCAAGDVDGDGGASFGAAFESTELSGRAQQQVRRGERGSSRGGVRRGGRGQRDGEGVGDLTADVQAVAKCNGRLADGRSGEELQRISVAAAAIAKVVENDLAGIVDVRTKRRRRAESAPGNGTVASMLRAFGGGVSDVDLRAALDCASDVSSVCSGVECVSRKATGGGALVHRRGDIVFGRQQGGERRAASQGGGDARARMRRVWLRVRREVEDRLRHTASRAMRRGASAPPGGASRSSVGGGGWGADVDPAAVRAAGDAAFRGLSYGEVATEAVGDVEAYFMPRSGVCEVPPAYIVPLSDVVVQRPVDQLVLALSTWQLERPVVEASGSDVGTESVAASSDTASASARRRHRRPSRRAPREEAPAAVQPDRSSRSSRSSQVPSRDLSQSSRASGASSAPSQDRAPSSHRSRSAKRRRPAGHQRGIKAEDEVDSAYVSTLGIVPAESYAPKSLGSGSGRRSASSSRRNRTRSRSRRDVQPTVTAPPSRPRRRERSRRVRSR